MFYDFSFPEPLQVVFHIAAYFGCEHEQADDVRERESQHHHIRKLDTDVRFEEAPIMVKSRNSKK